MSESTTSQGARGGFVTIIGQAIKISIQMASVIILSRLLNPEDFGLVAMTTVFISLGSLLRDFGLPIAALQAKNLSNQQASNLFWLNTALGIIAAGLLIIATPLIIMFYDEQRLLTFMPIVAISIIFGGASAQLQVNLARHHKFTALSLSDVTSQTIGLITAIFVAISGAGYWALVWQMLATAISLMLFQLLALRWRPSLPRRGHQTRKIIKSGTNFGGAELLTYISMQADTLVIGSKWGANDLGIYNRAFQLLSLPMQAILSPLTRVVIPTVNNARNAGKSIDSLLLPIQFIVGISTVWIFLLAATTANQIIPLLLGEGWEESISLFQILAIGGAVRAFSHVSYWGFILYDQSNQLLRYNLVTKTFTILSIIIAATFSIEAVAWAYSASLLISWPINLIWLKVSAKQNSWAYFKNGMMILSSAGFSAFITLFMLFKLEERYDDIPTIILSSSVSTLIFFIGILLFPGGYKELSTGFNIIKAAIRRKGPDPRSVDANNGSTGSAPSEMTQK